MEELRRRKCGEGIEKYGESCVYIGGNPPRNASEEANEMVVKSLLTEAITNRTKIEEGRRRSQAALTSAIRTHHSFHTITRHFSPKSYYTCNFSF